MPLDISKLKSSTLDLDQLSDPGTDLSKAIARINEPYSSLARLMEPSNSMRRMLDQIEESNRMWTQEITSPLHELVEQQRRISEQWAAAMQPSTTAWNDIIRQTQIAAEQFREAYRMTAFVALPGIDATAYRLPVLGEISSIARGLRSYNDSIFGVSRSIAKAMELISTPWVSAVTPLQSATSFAELNTLGALLKSHAAFGPNLTEALRTSLGDWRDDVTYPDALIDHPVREGLYDDRGFDRNLVEFPDEAFDETLVLAGIALLDTPRSAAESAGLRRSRQMFALLQTLETQLRILVDDLMTNEFGPSWTRAKAGANNSHDEWQQKKDKDERGGDRPLIEYADFTDYERIILRQDNWNAVFRHIFGRRREDIKESLQRLYPARLATMHARPLGNDDYVLASFEVRRLLIAVTRRRT